METKREWIFDGLHIFVLCGFAIAQPLFAVLAKGPEFFVARRSQPLDICLLVLVLCMGLPAVIVALEGLVGLISRTARRVLHLGVVAVLLMIILLPVLKRIEAIPAVGCVLGAVVLGIAAAVGYWYFRWVRTFVTVLAPAIIVFPAMFLFYSPVAGILRQQPGAATKHGNVKIENPAPVILVILDEFSSVALMDDEHQIDPIRYPNFAALARESTWFRNATTVSPKTTVAIPSILTGKYPEKPKSRRSSKSPIVDYYPDNLFTLLAGTYQLRSMELCTNLCPGALNVKAVTPGFSKRVKGLASDLWVVYCHIFVPYDLLPEDFPQIGDKWADFRKPTKWRRKKVDRGYRVVRFRNCIHALRPTKEPKFFFIHSMLPHLQLDFLPSTKRYNTPIRLDRAVGGKLWRLGMWIDDEKVVAEYYQRYLLQVGCTDTLIGQMVRHLKRVGLYDDALIVITSDHGVSHCAGELRRAVTKSTAGEVMPIPLFIKTPHQRKGGISDRNVESIDILPTIAQVLGVKIPWQIDGCSALDSSIPQRAHKMISPHLVWSGCEEEPLFTDAAFEAKYKAVERKLKLFGTGKDPHGLYRLGPHGELVGRRVEDVQVVGVAEADVELDNPSAFEGYSPKDGFVPARIQGRIRCRGDLRVPISLAVAVNGVIRGVAESQQLTGGAGQWATIVAEESFRPGKNRVQVYLVSEGEGGLTLSRLPEGNASSVASKPEPAAATK